MHARILVSAVVISLTPLAAIAMCGTKQQSANQCAQGQIWDSQAQSCVPLTSS